MTAEIVVMNKSGVALAADSAASIVTSQNTKIYNTNKLFMLSKYHPVGIMVYGSAELMSIPWETIIKGYRKTLKDTSYKRLEEYAQNFLTYLNNNSFLFSATAQEEHVYAVTYMSLSRLKKRIDKTVEERTHKGVKISTTDIEQIVSQTIKLTFDFIVALQRLPTLPTTFERDVLSAYHKIVDQAIDDVFKKHKLPASVRKQLRRIAVGLFVKDTFNVRDESGRELISSSGIVIAGFGEDDLYPALVAYEMEGVVHNTLKYREYRTINITSIQSAGVIPFAQDEMVRSFMEGIAPNYKDALNEFLNGVFDEYPGEIVKKFPHLTPKQKQDLVNELKKAGATLTSTFRDNVGGWADKYNIQPILNTVALLPIDELASMAESLVNLTSFKRRVTLVAETVGGPIDVALISKGDGFIWIKRKHYFEATDNPHFYENYYR